MRSLGMMKGLLAIVLLVQSALAQFDVNEIYSFDLVANQGGKALSLTIDSESKNATLKELSGSNGSQRFIMRVNSDSTFTLFVEAQPWNWVEHIVERTKYVNIQQIPQVLGVLGGTKDVKEQDYQGTGANGQIWYVVPTGDNPNVGVITSMLLRQCLTGQGENEPLTLTPCNFADPNQVFTVEARTTGRYC